MAWKDVESSANGNKMEYTKFPEGATLIRILDEEPYSFWQHWIPAAKTSATCIGKGCPICNIIAQAKANKETSPYGNNHRHALRVWNYTTNRMEVMIQGKTFMSNLLALNKEVGDLRTYDVKVIRSGTDKNTSYMCLPTTVSEFAYKDNITEVDFEELFKAPSPEGMIQLMEGKSWADINDSNNVNDVA